MIRVLKGGIQTTIQGSRRSGFLSLGFPSSGPTDSLSMFGANYLTGNSAYNATLEMYIQGPTIEFETDTTIAICGANMSPEIDGQLIPQHEIVSVSKGSRLSFKPATDGLIAYLSFNGALQVPSYLQSKSTYLPAALGGIHGRALKKGDVLEFDAYKEIKSVEIPNILKYINQKKHQIRVLKGPEYDSFSKKDQELFINNNYSISKDSNRMGIRLNSGFELNVSESDIVSSAVLPGTVQIPKNGNPIVMMYDHQTTGGYSRVANVITHDLDYLAQALPGSEISFRMIDRSKSVELFKKRTCLINQLFEDRSIS